MNGAEMMLKSLGIDPEKIKEVLVKAQSEVMGQIKQVNDKLDRIEKALGIEAEKSEGGEPNGSNSIGPGGSIQ